MTARDFPGLAATAGARLAAGAIGPVWTILG
jgi:hypothetical protein